ncbi:MAG: hypothetical protein ABH950_01900 [Candidatus Altiarchaeota archaeon]
MELLREAVLKSEIGGSSAGADKFTRRLVDGATLFLTHLPIGLGEMFVEWYKRSDCLGLLDYLLRGESETECTAVERMRAELSHERI